MGVVQMDSRRWSSTPARRPGRDAPPQVLPGATAAFLFDVPLTRGSQNGESRAREHPVVGLLHVLVGMLAFAAILDWLVAGREPRQGPPIE